MLTKNIPKEFRILINTYSLKDLKNVPDYNMCLELKQIGYDGLSTWFHQILPEHLKDKFPHLETYLSAFIDFETSNLLEDNYNKEDKVSAPYWDDIFRWFESKRIYLHIWDFEENEDGSYKKLYDKDYISKLIVEYKKKYNET